ncbi:hypothetical protein ALI144C_43395 [Actinosynnema sp. ALI-1.44]|uniref:hypothetical protein n=1 Tax=Actinosynnema sp. ALI-1.44 TaxID=1933779 RepID=UPI00097C211D|nr:hypothetical protein [Actinosynnema sp. ALI-1.44]ONI72844.1 hypothetical protein ALI144C_43395 [Actinosynnema sp. ALI-1.44]
MRKTIRRSILITATAACALGFGVFQASAAPAPTLPGLPLSGLGALTNLGTLTNLNDSLALMPTMPTMPEMPAVSAEESRDLPVGNLPVGDLAGLGGLTKLLSASQLTGDLLGVGPVTDLTKLSGTGGLPTDKLGLPTDKLGLPTTTRGLPTDKVGQVTDKLDLPVDLTQLLTQPQLPTEPSDITNASIVGTLDPHNLPVVAEGEHKMLVESLARGLDSLDVQGGLSKSTGSDLATQAESVQLPAGSPQMLSVQSGGLPEQLPVVSGVDAADASSITGLAGGLGLPKV